MNNPSYTVDFEINIDGYTCHSLTKRDLNKVIGKTAADMAARMDVELNGNDWQGSMDVIDSTETSYIVTIIYDVSPGQMQKIARHDGDAGVISWDHTPRFFTIQ